MCAGIMRIARIRGTMYALRVGEVVSCFGQLDGYHELVMIVMQLLPF